MRKTIAFALFAAISSTAVAVCPKSIDGNYSAIATKDQLDQCPSGSDSGPSGWITCSTTSKFAYTLNISGGTVTIGALVWADQFNQTDWQTPPAPAQITYSQKTCTGTMISKDFGTVGFVVANGGSQLFAVSGQKSPTSDQAVYSITAVRQ